MGKIAIYYVIVIGLLVGSYLGLRKGNSFDIYLVAFMTLFGWITGVIAIGVGFAALPFEYFWSWIIRP